MEGQPVLERRRPLKRLSDLGDQLEAFRRQWISSYSRKTEKGARLRMPTILLRIHPENRPSSISVWANSSRSPTSRENPKRP